MYYLDSDQYDPSYNLALEEYLFLQRPDLTEVFFLWQNAPTVVIGRNQNPLRETNLHYLKAQDIHLIRRNSGGGAVFHDLGNLNFTFITPQTSRQLDFQRFTQPVLTVLNQWGVPAVNDGRNDLTVEGRKISGNAQYHQAGRILHHGTLLFAVDFHQMEQALTVDPAKLHLRGVSSVRSRVANIQEYLPGSQSLAAFKARLLEHLTPALALSAFDLTRADQAEIQQLQQKKYQSWSWNYGQSPSYQNQNRHRFSWGELVCQWEIKKGCLSALSFQGDFFQLREMQDLSQQLLRLPFQAAVLEEALAQIDLSSFIPDLQTEDLLRLLQLEAE